MIDTITAILIIFIKVSILIFFVKVFAIAAAVAGALACIIFAVLWLAKGRKTKK